MNDMIQDGLDWLEGRRKEHLARPATYRRGNLSVAVDVTPAATRYESRDDYGVTLEVEMRDFLVAAEELVLDGWPVEPRPGDRIHVERDDVTFVYEAMELGPEGCFRACDPGYRTYRIHTKRVEVI